MAFDALPIHVQRSIDRVFHAVLDDADDDDGGAGSVCEKNMKMRDVPRALQLLDLPPDDDQVLAVFRNAASGWSAPDSGEVQDDPTGGGLIAREDWRAVCAVLLEHTDHDDNDDDAPSDDLYEENQDEDLEDDQDDDEYTDIPRTRRTRARASSPPLSDQNLTKRQRDAALAAFTLFFPHVPPQDVPKQRIYIKDIQRVAAMLGEKIKADEMIEMLDAFSTAPDKSSNPNEDNTMIALNSTTLLLALALALTGGRVAQAAPIGSKDVDYRAMRRSTGHPGETNTNTRREEPLRVFRYVAPSVGGTWDCAEGFALYRRAVDFDDVPDTVVARPSPNPLPTRPNPQPHPNHRNGKLAARAMRRQYEVQDADGARAPAPDHVPPPEPTTTRSARRHHVKNEDNKGRPVSPRALPKYYPVLRATSASSGPDSLDKVKDHERRTDGPGCEHPHPTCTQTPVEPDKGDNKTPPTCEPKGDDKTPEPEPKGDDKTPEPTDDKPGSEPKGDDKTPEGGDKSPEGGEKTPESGDKTPEPEPKGDDKTPEPTDDKPGSEPKGDDKTPEGGDKNPEHEPKGDDKTPPTCSKTPEHEPKEDGKAPEPEQPATKRGLWGSIAAFRRSLEPEQPAKREGKGLNGPIAVFRRALEFEDLPATVAARDPAGAPAPPPAPRVAARSTPRNLKEDIVMPGAFAPRYRHTPPVPPSVPVPAATSTLPVEGRQVMERRKEDAASANIAKVKREVPVRPAALTSLAKRHEARCDAPKPKCNKTPEIDERPQPTKREGTGLSGPISISRRALLDFDDLPDTVIAAPATTQPPTTRNGKFAARRHGDNQDKAFVLRATSEYPAPVPNLETEVRPRRGRPSGDAESANTATVRRLRKGPPAAGETHVKPRPDVDTTIAPTPPVERRQLQDAGLEVKCGGGGAKPKCNKTPKFDVDELPEPGLPATKREQRGPGLSGPIAIFRRALVLDELD
ncbi:hypothetical protein DXG03_009483 [Asterophora parasitica]|uniref:Uncharacterized protein n=1 Tax=Asterophora parasitica TaxID=117018 RepID=A0A9P7G695_9AGAR|nr:hypothetical protein DXG03_009483 [Asterophora parasitica]